MLTKYDKIQMVEEKLFHINYALESVKTRIDSGELDIPGKPTMEYLLNHYSAIKMALNSELSLLTNLE